jgi:hypothetical protein
MNPLNEYFFASTRIEKVFNHGTFLLVNMTRQKRCTTLKISEMS